MKLQPAANLKIYRIMEMTEKQRYGAAVLEMNNFVSGIYNLPEPVELEGDLEVSGVDLNDDETVYVTPKHSIWGDAYSLHHFAVGIDSLSDEAIRDVRLALEADIEERAAWWDQE